MRSSSIRVPALRAEKTSSGVPAGRAPTSTDAAFASGWASGTARTAGVPGRATAWTSRAPSGTARMIAACSRPSRSIPSSAPGRVSTISTAACGSAAATRSSSPRGLLGADARRQPEAHLVGRGAADLADAVERAIEVGEQPAAVVGQRETGGGRRHRARRAFHQRDPELVLQRRHRPGHRLLRHVQLLPARVNDRRRTTASSTRRARRSATTHRCSICRIGVSDPARSRLASRA